MTAALDELPDEDHPALLLARAHELVNEADELLERSKALRAEAAKLTARAQRAHEQEVVRPKPRRTDPLLGAAALAVEELTGRWTLDEFARALQIRDRARAVALAQELNERQLVIRDGDGWRTANPDESRVRDALHGLGVCEPQEIAQMLELTLEAVDYQLDEGEQRGWAQRLEDGYVAFQRPGPERVLTRYPKRRPPEKEPPAGLDAPARGEPVRVVHHGKRGGQMSNPGQRHQIKLRDQRREKQEAARRERAAKQRGK